MYTRFPCTVQNQTFHSLSDLQTHASNLMDASEEWEKTIWQQILRWSDPKLDNMQIQSSGSTGKPSLHTHKKVHMLASAQATIHYFSITENALLLCLPSDKIGGLMMIVRALSAGLPLLYVKPSGTIEIPKSQPIALIAVTPHQASKTLGSVSTNELQLITNWLIGGAGVSNDLVKLICSKEIQAYESFGMTETISHIALRQIQSEMKPFEALEHVQISIDESNQTLRINSESLGISNLATHDVIEMTKDNCFFRKGRTDFVINTGGIKIHPEELEKKIAGKIAFPYFVAGKKDTVWGQRPILICETDGPDTELYKKLNTQLSGPEKLAGQINIHSFVYTSNGKIARLQTLALIDDLC